jgi:hypothetical protein
MTYDRRRLRLAAMIRRIEPASRLLLRLMAVGQPCAQPELRQPLRIIDGYIIRSRFGTAACKGVIYTFRGQ